MNKAIFCLSIIVCTLFFTLTACISPREMDALQKNLKKINRDITQISSEIGKLNSEIGKITNEINRDIGQVKSEIDKLNSEIDKIPDELGKLTAELANINTQFQQKMSIVEETRKGQVDIKKTLSDIDRIMETGRKNQADIKTDMGSLSDELQQVTSKIDEYVHLIDNLNQKLDSIDVRLTQLSEIYKTTIEKSKKEELTTKDIYQKLNSLGVGLNSLQSELAPVKTEINSLNEKVKELVEREEVSTNKRDIVKPSIKDKSEVNPPVENSNKEERKNISDLPRFLAEQLKELPASAEEPSAAESRLIVALKPEELYKTAYSDYLKGSFRLAITGFRDYMEKYPDTGLAGNSQYWIAESYYSMDDYEMAVLEFNKVINKYPKNTKTPSAMLKIAYSKVRLNQVTNAISVFNDIIKKYPNSDEARLSKERLKSIKK